MDGNGCSIGTHILSYKPELLDYLRAFITDDRKIIHGNSELKRLIRMYDFLKYKKAFDISATSE